MASPQQTDPQNKAADFEDPWESYADLSVGEILTRTREYYNLTLQDVEAALRIRREQLQALEQDNFESLPGRVYAIGFVRTYSEYLGLDGARMVHIYKKQAGGKLHKPQVHIPAPASESKLPSFVILGLSLLILAASVMTYIWINDDGPPTEIVAPEAQAGPVYMTRLAYPPLEYAFADALRAVSGATGAEAFLRPQGQILIRVEETAWIEIKNADGDIRISEIMKAGDTYVVPDEEGLELATGNIGGLAFTVNGQEIAGLGKTGEVRRSLPLTPDELLAVSAGP